MSSFSRDRKRWGRWLKATEERYLRAMLSVAADVEAVRGHPERGDWIWMRRMILQELERRKQREAA